MNKLLPSEPGLESRDHQQVMGESNDDSIEIIRCMANEWPMSLQAKSLNQYWKQRSGRCPKKLELHRLAEITLKAFSVSAPRVDLKD